ncbi:MAG: hypothetical protein CMQ51_00735 [Gammaproteobacteria bacterium]|nr:hypothetical protein [Gammaproteobacteria bacterium]
MKYKKEYLNKNPFDILDISYDSDMKVIDAAYKINLEVLNDYKDTDIYDKLRDEVEWAYWMLCDSVNRGKFRMDKISDKNINIDPSEILGEDLLEMSEDEPEKYLGSSNKILSVVLSTGLLVLMVGAVGYALYFVGAVPESRIEDSDNSSALRITTEENIRNSAVASTDLPEISVGHTATVAALKETATHEALLDYSNSLTATRISRNAPTFTPTVVLRKGCIDVTSVNVRSGPGTSYKILGQLLMDDCAVIVGRNEEGTWLNILDTPRESLDDGWVSIDLILVEGEVDEIGIVDVEN